MRKFSYSAILALVVFIGLPVAQASAAADASVSVQDVRTLGGFEWITE